MIRLEKRTKSRSDATKSTEMCADKRRFGSVPPLFTFVDQISSHSGLVSERNPLIPNIPEFRDDFVAALSEIEGDDLAVIFTHFCWLSWQLII